MEGVCRYKSVKCRRSRVCPPGGRSSSAWSSRFPASPATTLTTRTNAVTNRHAWNLRMTLLARSIATLGLYDSLPDKAGTAAGRSRSLDTGIAAADAAAAVPARVQPLMTPAENRETLATVWNLSDMKRDVLRRMHPLYHRDAAVGFATSCTDGFAGQFFFEALQRSSHGCGAASAMIRVAAPAAPAAKGATWMD